MKKLFLLDAMALIYRAHFAFQKNPRISSKGLNTSAVFGFTNTLLEILQKEKPTHLGVAFDTPTPTFRHIQFEAYKAQREKQPEDITLAIPYIKRLCAAMNIPVLQLDGYEADDVIGTFAKKAVNHDADIEVIMMTPDKDYGQLVEERIKIYKPAFMGKGPEILGVKEICERWAIKEVSLVIDMLGLMGDASDNIPGIPGIGEKTAQKLIQEFGSLENVINGADKLKGKQQENVINFAQQGLISKELATIHCEVPLVYDQNELEITEPNLEELAILLDELEFRTMRKRFGLENKEDVNSQDLKSKTTKKSKQIDSNQSSLFGDDSVLSTINQSVVNLFSDLEKKENIHTTTHNYQLIDSPELRESLIGFLQFQESICFDTETTSLDAVDAQILGLAFSYQKNEAFYVPFPHDFEQAKAILSEFKELFLNENIEKIAQNIKYDLMILNNYGIAVKGKLYDTMLAHYIIEPEKRHGMDILAENYLNYTPISI
ncbi:MAG: DNA polymerase I, partial [Pseudarcicella sp.]|nr:DNA polymerase I [Pseudarcicella sp.]